MGIGKKVGLMLAMVLIISTSAKSVPAIEDEVIQLPSEWKENNEVAENFFHGYSRKCIMVSDPR